MKCNYPDKAVPLVGGKVKRPVVVVMDQLHLVVETHLVMDGHCFIRVCGDL